MMLRCILPLAAFTVLLALGTVGQAQLTKLSDDARIVARDNNAFACDLYAQLAKKDGNLFYSPYSISSALAMTYAGAKGQTAQEMAQTMHFDLPADKLHPAAGELIHHFNAQGKDRPYQLSVANALWGQKGLNFLPEFLKLTESQYAAKLAELDFSKHPEPSRQTINAWVEKQTHDKIKNLIPEGVIKPYTRLVLTNAIYFKSAWSEKFLKEATKPEEFTLTTGAKVKVPTMAKTENLSYGDFGTFTAVSIPYEMHALSLIVLLPKQAAGLAEVEKSLTVAQLEKVQKGLKMHEVNLKLPKFKVTTQFDLSDTLIAMGMKQAFTGGADFSGMTTQDKLFITNVIHKAFIDLHEEGTEAAAATAVVMGGDSKPPSFPKAAFHADHAFLYLIRENQTGSILFMGRLADPQP